MPRKAKDNGILNKEKTTVTKKKLTKKTTPVKDKKTTKLNSTTKKLQKNKTTEKKVSNRKKTTIKKENFLMEYYDLPFNYNKTVVKLLAQTPERLFVYWEISEEDRNNYKKLYGDNFFETTIPVLKVFNRTKNYSFEVEINDFANCWYLPVNDSKCDYQIELIRKKYNENTLPTYIHISESNNLEIPNDHILFEQNLSKVQFKNVKTNEIKNVDITKDIEKIYNIKNLYNLLYTEDSLNNFNILSNPSSTSTFK